MKVNERHGGTTPANCANKGDALRPRAYFGEPNLLETAPFRFFYFAVLAVTERFLVNSSLGGSWGLQIGRAH
ncbi:MAG: hypothetical protein LBE01_05800, partial [Deltaproteobacteria bacterium]|nr:hypothetical protein [Deltaproteobacteria bacterium]